jgi:hypothetical protein
MAPRIAGLELLTMNSAATLNPATAGRCHLANGYLQLELLNYTGYTQLIDQCPGASVAAEDETGAPSGGGKAIAFLTGI